MHGKYALLYSHHIYFYDLFLFARMQQENSITSYLHNYCVYLYTAENGLT